MPDENPTIDLAEGRRRLIEHFGSRVGVLGHMLLSLSASGQPTDVTFHRRLPILDVTVDRGLSIAVVSGIDAARLARMFNTGIRFSDGTVAPLREIWTVCPMPFGGIPQAELDAVDLARAEEQIGPQGETMREIVRNTYRCRNRAEEDRFLRRFIAS